MRLSIISFTNNGIQLSRMVAEKLRECEIEPFLFTKYSCFSEAANEKKDADSARDTLQTEAQVQPVTESLTEWTMLQMQEKNALLFIGACGIAVRAIAPCLVNKLEDSPVLVLDEMGAHIIPVLAGHVGGGNELALLLAKKIGAEPVITTATDLHRKFAVDLFAKKNHLHIENKDGIAKVSAKVLAGKEITMSIEEGHFIHKEKIPEGIRLMPWPPAEGVDILITSKRKKAALNENKRASIVLHPKEYVIGMGCKKGKEADKIEALIKKTLKETGIEKEQVYALASIDVKSKEEGLLAWSRKERIPFLTFSAEELGQVEGSFTGSDFVKEQVGVDNVCERAALAACGAWCEKAGLEACGLQNKEAAKIQPALVYKKHAEDGMTIAVAKREWSVAFDEA